MSRRLPGRTVSCGTLNARHTAAGTFADVMSALKAAREAAGLSLSDVEERTGINKSNLSLLENGKGKCPLQRIRIRL